MSVELRAYFSYFFSLFFVTSSCEKQLPVYPNADTDDFLSEFSESNNELNKKNYGIAFFLVDFTNNTARYSIYVKFMSFFFGCCCCIIWARWFLLSHGQGLEYTWKSAAQNINGKRYGEQQEFPTIK